MYSAKQHPASDQTSDVNENSTISPQIAGGYGFTRSTKGFVKACQVTIDTLILWLPSKAAVRRIVPLTVSNVLPLTLKRLSSGSRGSNAERGVQGGGRWDSRKMYEVLMMRTGLALGIA
ncbi:hypothetical protein CIB48_g6823 [Xylaria polymorpha]|nr:hypothetical protein CIB48_g6823 [Xylaria polymorpha]